MLFRSETRGDLRWHEEELERRSKGWEKAEAERDALKERLNEAAMWDERREEEIKALQARVKELESGERFTETMFRKLEKAGWKFDELRGEDSG